MQFLESKEGKKVMEHVTLKNLKTGFGHDRNGAFADFYLDGKKMGYYNDDGWGGETNIVYENDANRAAFEKFLTDNGVAEIMFGNGWDFIGSADKIELHSQVDEVINAAINLVEAKKLEKKMTKACEKGIYRKTANGYTGIAFAMSLNEIAKKKGGSEFLQKNYDKVKASLQKGEYIINNNLSEFGVRV